MSISGLGLGLGGLFHEVEREIGMHKYIIYM